MAQIIWNDRMSVEVEEIDKQHQKLIEMINALGDAMTNGKGRSVIGEIIEGLADYAVTHFETEEEYFNKFEYPQSAAHKKEHDDFVKRVLEFKKGFEKGELSLSVEVMMFLRDWLKKHIMDEDKKYVPFFNKVGLN